MCWPMRRLSGCLPLANLHRYNVVALRLACARWGARGVAASDRLDGGKRDTAFRAGVNAALAALEAGVEAGAGAGRRESVSVTLGGYPPDVFLSDLARDLGVTPQRAGRLVTNATARRAANRLLQAVGLILVTHA
jgi:hypothetical protein